MDNDQHFFFRLKTNPDRIRRDGQREYPKEVFPFGLPGVALFAHEYEGIWHVTEVSTGLLLTRGNELFAAHADAEKIINEMGREKFIAAIKDILSKLNEGLEYDCESKQWIDPDKPRPFIAPEISGGADD
ncbi:MAG: hypothetical protein JW901_05380 [Dehalococcoidia bacterium]|nr:hypothetical protein [Dehalococcoidia bacterium]